MKLEKFCLSTRFFLLTMLSRRLILHYSDDRVLLWREKQKWNNFFIRHPLNWIFIISIQLNCRRVRKKNWKLSCKCINHIVDVDTPWNVHNLAFCIKHQKFSSLLQLIANVFPAKVLNLFHIFSVRHHFNFNLTWNFMSTNLLNIQYFPITTNDGAVRVVWAQIERYRQITTENWHLHVPVILFFTFFLTLPPPLTVTSFIFIIIVSHPIHPVTTQCKYESAFHDVHSIIKYFTRLAPQSTRYHHYYHYRHTLTT